jgi:hypothetical protein
MPIPRNRLRAAVLGVPVLAAVAIAGCGGASTAKPSDSDREPARQTNGEPSRSGPSTPCPPHGGGRGRPRAGGQHPAVPRTSAELDSGTCTCTSTSTSTSAELGSDTRTQHGSPPVAERAGAHDPGNHPRPATARRHRHTPAQRRRHGRR